MTGQHRRSLRDRVRHWMSRPERVVSTAHCKACTDADEGRCSCLMDCGRTRCTGGFR